MDATEPIEQFSVTNYTDQSTMIRVTHIALSLIILLYLLMNFESIKLLIFLSLLQIIGLAEIGITFMVTSLFDSVSFP